MADTYEHDLAEVASLALTDFVRAVTTPGAVAESQVISLANFQASIIALVNLTSLMVPALQVRTTATFTKTSSTAFANVPGLEVNLLAGHNYRITARVYSISGSSGGVKATLSGTVTPGLLVYDGITYSQTALAKGVSATALRTAVGEMTSVTNGYTEITGFIAVAVGGTLTVQFAQNASNGTASVVQIGSSLFVEDVT